MTSFWVRAKKQILQGIGVLFVVLGIVGYILPVMPGTIFLILALSCFEASGSGLYNWLYNHPKFGPTLQAWKKHGCISTRIKVLATTLILVSMGTSAWMCPIGWVKATLVVTAGLLIGFICTRPSRPIVAEDPAKVMAEVS
jgi:uncharacterized protein